MRLGYSRKLKPLRFFIRVLKFIRDGTVKRDKTWKTKGTGCVQQRKRTQGSERKRLWEGRAPHHALSPKPEAGSDALEQEELKSNTGEIVQRLRLWGLTGAMRSMCEDLSRVWDDTY